MIWSHTDVLYLKEDLDIAGCMLLFRAEKSFSKTLVRGEEEKRRKVKDMIFNQHPPNDRRTADIQQKLW